MQEAERRAIARELHDSAGQSLTAIRIHMQLIEGLAAKAEPVPPPETNEAAGAAPEQPPGKAPGDGKGRLRELAARTTVMVDARRTFIFMFIPSAKLCLNLQFKSFISELLSSNSI